MSRVNLKTLYLMFIPAQKLTDAGEYLTDFTKPKPLYVVLIVNLSASVRRLFRRVPLTFLGIFLAGHGDHLSQREDQADGNPRAQRGAHVCTPDMQCPPNPTEEEVKESPGSELQHPD